MSRFSKNHLFVVFLLGVFYIFLGASSAHAQSIGGISLASIPENPEPYETVSVSINQYGVDTFGASIRWYINNVEQTGYRDARSIEFIAGGLAEQTIVTMVASKPNSPTLTASKTFSPTLVDLIIEADTYTPTFYQGRALPSKDAGIRVIAVLNGVPLDPAEYAYKWTLGNQVLFGGPVRGKRAAELEMPRFSNKKLRVEIYDTRGSRVAERLIILDFYKPELHFYEESPLRGLIEKTIENELLMSGSQTTISAEPYFINVPLISVDTLYEWEINGRNTDADFRTPNKLTLQKTEDSDSMWLSLDMITTKGIPQFVNNKFRLLFR